MRTPHAAWEGRKRRGRCGPFCAQQGAEAAFLQRHSFPQGRAGQGPVAWEAHQASLMLPRAPRRCWPLSFQRAPSGEDVLLP